MVIFLQTEHHSDRKQSHRQDTCDDGAPSSFEYKDCRTDDNISQSQPAQINKNQTQILHAKELKDVKLKR